MADSTQPSTGDRDVILAKLETQMAVLNALQRSLDEFKEGIRKILDDQEDRLRKQAATTSEQQGEILRLRGDLAEIRSTTTLIREWQQRQDDQRLVFWQQAFLKLLPAVGLGGGVVAGVGFLMRGLGFF